MQLPGDERLPRYRRVLDAVLAEVARGKWVPGGRLPAEQELARKYGVAPGTVRQAISNLVQDGVLERHHGQGTFVRQPKFASSLFRFFRFEGATGDTLYPEGKILSCERMAPPKEVVEQLALSPRAGAICISRLRLVQKTPVLAEEIWLPYGLFKPFLKLRLDEIGPLLYPIYQQECGQIVARAEETLTVAKCDDAAADLLAIEMDTPAIVIERLARGYDGTPLEWRRTIGRADKFRYRTEIR